MVLVVLGRQKDTRRHRVGQQAHMAGVVNGGVGDGQEWLVGGSPCPADASQRHFKASTPECRALWKPGDSNECGEGTVLRC